MKHCLFLHILLLSLLCSCVEEYNHYSQQAEKRMLVIEGEIAEFELCFFTVRHTINIVEDSPKEAFRPIYNAILVVKGTDGCEYEAFFDSEYEQYVVAMGETSPNEKYWVEIDAPGYGVFKSEPMKPLDAPYIKEINVSAPRNDYAYISVTTQELKGNSYLLWEYKEFWKVKTPYATHWQYDPYLDDFLSIPSSQMTNIGWGMSESKEKIFASNENYGLGAFKNQLIYQRDKSSLLFRTRYMTRIKQKAISAEEYEYRKLLQEMTENTGGLFTIMPAELPGNIFSETGDAKAIGFIGVRGYVDRQDKYFTPQEVGYIDWVKAKYPKSGLSNLYLYQHGYAPYDYNIYTNESSWCENWCVDCTDEFWLGGASTEKPWFWEDEETE